MCSCSRRFAHSKANINKTEKTQSSELKYEFLQSEKKRRDFSDDFLLDFFSNELRWVVACGKVVKNDLPAGEKAAGFKARRLATDAIESNPVCPVSKDEETRTTQRSDHKNPNIFSHKDPDHSQHFRVQTFDDDDDDDKLSPCSNLHLRMYHVLDKRPLLTALLNDLETLSSL